MSMLARAAILTYPNLDFRNLFLGYQGNWPTGISFFGAGMSLISWIAPIVEPS